jgi:ketose-bisphosphate aldolase
MKIRDAVQNLSGCRGAILAVNVYNLETLRGVLDAASHRNSPIIIQMTRSTLEYIGLPIAVAMTRAASKELGLNAWLHLDHGDSIDLVARCLDVGFDSVMIDASERTFAENVDITRRVVRLTEKYGAAVEAELGYIAKLGQDKNTVSFTEPGDARRFVTETGVDWLAVAVGNMHGFYRGSPAIDIDRIREIAKVTDVPLVLHGSSGIPASQLQAAIRAGITKVNLATEIKQRFMVTLKQHLEDETNIDLREVFPVATRGVTELVSEKLAVVSGASDNVS